MPKKLKNHNNVNDKLRNVYSESDLQRIDPKTQEKVIFQCTVCAFAKTNINRQQIMDRDQLNNLLSSHLRKRKSHRVQLLCFYDRIVFRKRSRVANKPLRYSLYYRDIEHYYYCDEHKNIFMLSIKSANPQILLYETYKCKEETNASHLCDLICKACRDPDKILKTTTSENVTQSVNDLNNQISHTEAPVQSKSMDNILEIQNDHDSVEMRSPSPDKNFTPSLSPSPIIVLQKPIEQIQVQKSARSPIFKSKSLNELNDGTIYFDYNPIHGTQINDTGPFYMYVARYPVSAE